MIFACACVFMLLFCSGTVLLKTETPEQLISGKWETVGWEFERINRNTATLDHKLLEHNRNELYSNRMFHKGKEWEFCTQNVLMLKQDESLNDRKINWFLKGRGHILELKYPNGKNESYHVHILTKDAMVVYYNFDLEKRGSVKITLKKIQELNYAQKI